MCIRDRYPVLDSHINEHMKEKYQPLAKAAAISILGGLDIPVSYTHLDVYKRQH